MSNDEFDALVELIERLARINADMGDPRHRNDETYPVAREREKTEFLEEMRERLVL